MGRPKRRFDAMKILKRTLIWLILMAVILFMVNLVGTLIVKNVGVGILEGSMTGYSMKEEMMIHPVLHEVDEEHKLNGLSGLSTRSLLSSERLRNDTKFYFTFMFLNFNVDISNIFWDEKGTNGLSEGIFSVVYEDKGEKLDYFRHSCGVLDINELIKLDCASELYDILEKNDDVRIRMDSYSVDSSFIVHPASFTVLDAGGNEIKKFDCPCSGEIVKGDNVYLYNEEGSYKKDKENSGYSVYKKMKDAYLGERKSDRIAKKYMEKADFSQNDQSLTERSYGLATITSKHVEVKEGKAQVTVQRFCFYKGVILYTAIFGAIMTLIMVLVCRSKDKKKAFGGYGGNYGNMPYNYPNGYNNRPAGGNYPNNYNGQPNNYPNNYNNGPNGYGANNYNNGSRYR